MVPDCKRLVGDGPKHPQREPDQRRQGDGFALCSTGVSLDSIQIFYIDIGWFQNKLSLTAWTELQPYKKYLNVK